jgi:hypothetical protein
MDEVVRAARGQGVALPKGYADERLALSTPCPPR